MRIRKIISVLLGAIFLLGADAKVRATEKATEAFAHLMLGNLGAIVVECPQAKDRKWDNFALICARYDSGFEIFKPAWDLYMMREEMKPMLASTVRPTTAWTLKENSYSRAYDVSGEPAYVFFPVGGNTVLIAYTRKDASPTSANGFAREIETARLVAGKNGVPEPLAIFTTLPTYPKRAKKARVEAQVVLQAIILKSGSVGKVRVIQCSRRNFGFEKAATDALKKWRFEPTQKDGEPVEASLMTTIEFTL